MTLTNQQLEWIVAEVVRRLQTDATPLAASPATSTSTLKIPERLVTLETLRGKLNGVASVQVSDKAVVTPAVVDLLKEKQIKLQRA